MKKNNLFKGFLTAWVCFCSIWLTSSCESAQKVIVNDSYQNNHINICVLGNSYSNDAFCYVPFILREYGYTCKIHIYYKGSGSLQDLDEQWFDNTQDGIASFDGKLHIRSHYSIDTRIEDCWRTEPIASAEEILSLDKWDIVSLQQVSSHAQYIDTYEPYLSNVIERINSKCDYPFSLGWFMSYNRAKDNANEENLTTQRLVCDRNSFEIVFPVAAAVFSAQNNEVLGKLGDSKYKKMYASDDTHLQEGIPCYIAALTIVETLLRLYFRRGTVTGNKIRPTDDWIKSINGITPNGLAIGVTDENCALAQQVAVNAFFHKFEITPLE